MRKAAFYLLICVLILSFVLPAASAEPASVERISGDFAYVLRDDGTARIIRYDGKEAVLTVPQALDGVPVTEIGSHTFQANDALTEAILPEGIVSLGDYAFIHCVNLVKVSLPASLVEVGLNPFTGCELLAGLAVAEGNPNLRIEEGVLFSLDDRRLIWYPMLKEPGSYTIPGSIRIIGASAFDQCENITEILIPDETALTAVGRRAFYQCDNLRAINLENANISTIGADAFNGCRGLEKLAFPEKITSIAERAFQDCSGLKELILPEAITSIGEMAFRNCERVTMI